MSDHSNISRQPDVGLPHATFNFGRQVRFAVAREVDVYLSRAQVQIQPRQGNSSKIQVSLPRSHVHAQLQGKVLCETEIPFVFRIAEVDRMGILRDIDLSHAIGDVVIDTRLVKGIAKSKIRVKRLSGPTIDI